MQISRYKKPVVVVGAAFVVGFCCFIFRNLDAWLEVSDPLPNSLDLLFTTSGEETRFRYSKKLFSQGRVSFWLLSYPTSAIADSLRKENFNIKRIGVVDSCANTQSEIACLEHWMESDCRWRQFIGKEARKDAQEVAKVGIVSNWYHMLRIKLIVTAQTRNRSVSYYYLPVPSEYDQYRNRYKSWWRQSAVRYVVFLEWKKIVYYFLKNPGLIFSLSSARHS
jgi:hypothetical protein